jgi:hypothetical protein
MQEKVRNLYRQGDLSDTNRVEKPLKSYDLRGFSFYFNPSYSSKTKENETYSVTHFKFLGLGHQKRCNVLIVN